MSFFRNVWSKPAISPPSPQAASEPDPPMDSMFAGLNIKPIGSLPPAEEPENYENSPIEEISESEPIPSAFSFLQAPSSSFTFISEESVQRSSSADNPDSVDNLPIDNPPSAKRHVSEPTRASSPIATNPDHSHDSAHELISDDDLPNPNNSIDRVEILFNPEFSQYNSELNRLKNLLSDRMIDHWKTVTKLDEENAQASKLCTQLLRKLSEANGEIEGLKIAQSRAVDDKVFSAFFYRNCSDGLLGL
jgi:hypothetical protein